MSNVRSTAGALLAALLAGCAGAALNVNWEHDPAADFSGMQTYDWMPGPQKKSGDPRIDDPFVDTRIRKAVEKGLAAKGYEQRARAPDFVIGYHAALRDEITTTTMDSYYGYHRSWGGDQGRGRGWNVGGPSITYGRSYGVGTLVLDIGDPDTHQLIWRGSALAEIGGSDSPKKRDERLDKAVRHMLESFPPPESSGSGDR